MIDLFSKIIELGVGACFLILAVLCLRPLLKKAPKWISCLLWGMVALRLVMPISLESELSLVPRWARVSLQGAERSAQKNEQIMANDGNRADGHDPGTHGMQEDGQKLAAQGRQEDGRDFTVDVERTGEQDSVARGDQTDVHASMSDGELADGQGDVKPGRQSEAQAATARENQVEGPNSAADDARRDDRGPTAHEALEPQKPSEVDSGIQAGASDQAGKMIAHVSGARILHVACVIWIAGVLVMLAYALFSYGRIRRKVSDGVRLSDGTYESREISGPFILGMLMPRIYLPIGLSEEARECILCHERAHLSRGDHLWKPLGFLLLSVYWFHPLLWLSYHLFCRDVEFACDEKATGNVNQEKRAIYCQTLLDLSADHAVSYACPLAFGEGDAKERIQSILNHKKAPRWFVATVLLLCLALGICFMTNPASKAADEGEMMQENGTELAEGEGFLDGGEDMDQEQNDAEPTEEGRLGEGYVSLANEITSLESASRILGNLPLYYCDGNETRAIKLTDVPALFQEEADPYFQCWCFSIVDLDGDGAEEVILQCYGTAGDSGGKVILHQIGDRVYAYTAGYRMMWEIYADGTYSYSGWVLTNDGYARITEFSESGYVEDRFTYATGSYEGADTFVVDHQPVLKGDYDKAMTAIRSKRKIATYEFKEENLKRIADVFHAEVISLGATDFKKLVLREISQKSFEFPAGACTGGSLTINEDGSFSGAYDQRYDPPYHYWESRFMGRLEITEVVDEYTCHVKVTELTCEREIGSIRKDGECTFEEILPPGMEEGGEYLLCLPGKPMEELPRKILYTWGARIEKVGKWTSYGIGVIPKTKEEGYTDLSHVSYYDLQFDVDALALYVSGRYDRVMNAWNVSASSADGSRFAYGIVKDEGGAREFVIGTSNVDGSDAREMKIHPELGNELTGIWWLSDGTVGVELHVNPSTSEFIVCDLDNELEGKRYYGSSFTVIPGTSHVAYEGNVSHFGGGDAYPSYFIDDKKVYTSNLLNASLDTPYFSEDLSTITFREVLRDFGEERNMIGDFDLQGLRISNVTEERLRAMQAYAQIAEDYEKAQEAADGKPAFTLEDVNHDGMPEFLIARYYESSKEFITQDVYTWHEGKAIKLLPERELGDRSGTIEVCEDGYVLYRWSGSAYLYGVIVYKLPYQGTSMQFSQEFYFLDQENGNDRYGEFHWRGSLSDESVVITEKEYQELVNHFQSVTCEFVINTEESRSLLRTGKISH